MFFNLNTDMLVITDSDRSGGLLADGKSAGFGTVASAGYVNLLWEMFFEGDVDSVDGAVERMVGWEGFAEGEGDPKADAMRILGSTPGLDISQKPADASGVERREVRQGFVDLDGTQSWHPEGVMSERKIGDHVMRFIDGSESFREHVTPDPSISLAGVRDTGPYVASRSKWCGACGVCGVCGACVFCAKINYYVGAGAAISAAAAVAAADRLTIDPSRVRDDFDILQFRDEKIEVLEEMERLAKGGG